MTILAVDDEKGALNLLTDAIHAAVENADVHPFNSPEEALTFAESAHVDVAFLDIQMFGMNGIDLAKKLKSTNDKMNLIFVTGYDEFAKDAVFLHASGYVTKPVTRQKVKEQTENLLHPAVDPKEKFFARTFGNFEFFVDGKPLAFARERSKELLAVLIDREGASLTTEQIAAVMYEERNYDRKLKNLLMPIIRSLQETLDSVGASDILVRTWGHLAVDTSKFRCDAYDYNAGDVDAINKFKGEYMASYSWGEERSAEFYWDRVEKSEKK